MNTATAPQTTPAADAAPEISVVLVEDDEDVRHGTAQAVQIPRPSPSPSAMAPTASKRNKANALFLLNSSFCC